MNLLTYLLVYNSILQRKTGHIDKNKYYNIFIEQLSIDNVTVFLG